MSPGAWIRTPRPRPAAAHRVVCFPHAGGSANFFRGWAHLRDDAEICIVQYPGRADRLDEACYEDLHRLADDACAAIEPYLERPSILLGHSMGAVVAYEVALRLEAAGRDVARLVVSASRAPHDPDSVVDRDVLWDDDAAMRSLVSLGGTDDPELLADPRVRRLVLPYLRADYTMFQRYRPAPGAELGCDVLVVRGADDPHVTDPQGERWRDVTRGGFGHEVVPGGHFYLAPYPPLDLFLSPLTSQRTYVK
ncbi:thioesterase II family protein [Nonomuraea typhae]|uniref:Thioesterase II family protein n=1 Tax=Nonomuraea typhae TaxID=2603600 RepID=A0ABW7Z8J9_9ACTN